MYDHRNYLNSSLDNISKWEDLNESLGYYLTLFSFNDASCSIREFIKLEEYLNCEYNVNEREKSMYFASQEKLREYLNQNLSEKYFRLSQSTSLFKELTIKLDHLFKRHLTSENLNDVLHKYNQLLTNYKSLFNEVKSKVKVRKSKYEGYLQTWRNFDLGCEHLDQLFNMNNPKSLKNLEFRSLVTEMSACLAKLKKHHGMLTSIVPERKYFEMKDLIILYELKLKEFREDYETKNEITDSVHNIKSDIASSEDISNDKIYEFFENLTLKDLLKKKIETSDKSTSTDEVSLKMAADPSALPVINAKTIKTNNYFNNQINEHRYSVVDRAYLKKSKFSKYKRVSDSKKSLLLEAYLKKNENLTNGGSTTTSTASYTLSVLHAYKKESSKNGAKNTHESGIGTTNDDELDSLKSIQNEYDYISELKHAVENEINKNNSYLYDEKSDTNLIRRNGLYAKKEKLLKIKVKQKPQNKQLTSNDEPFSRANSSNFIKQFLFSHEKESSTKLNDAIIPNDTNVRGKSSKPKSQEEEKLVKNEEAANSYYSLSWLLKRIFYIIFFAFPLGLLFLLIIYYYFVYFLNSICSDHQMNYLIWNII